MDSIKTMPTPARDRYPTDSELRRIKVAAHYGKAGKHTRMGPTLAALIDLAYLTGQHIGDLLDLRWNKRAALGADGLVEAPTSPRWGSTSSPRRQRRPRTPRC